MICVGTGGYNDTELESVELDQEATQLSVWNTGLTDGHLRIAQSPSTRIAVLAGPGTGKTGYGMMRRAARLLEDGVDSKSILMLSFTRTAAQDLRDKISNIGIDGAEHIRATTLHSFCLQLLSRESILRDLGRTPRILLDHEVRMMLYDVKATLKYKQAERMLEAMVSGWATRQTQHPGTAETPEEQAFDGRVMKWLRFHRAMLVGEVVPLTFWYARLNPDSDLFSTIRHLLVDEYQDLNYLEQDLIETIVSQSGCDICVVGDDDQSIYGFKHAHKDGIVDYFDRSDVQNISLDTCYRCPPPVLEAANSLISHSDDRLPRRLRAALPEQGSIQLVQWHDIEDEIEGVAAAIVADIETQRYVAGDILVLVQRQKIGEAVRRRLVSLGVPAHSYFNQEPLNSPESQRSLALLQFAVRSDRVALRVLLGLGDSTARSLAYAKLQAFAIAARLDVHDALDVLIAGNTPGLHLPKFKELYRAAKMEMELLPLEDLDQLIERLFPLNENTGDIRDIALTSRLVSKDSGELLDTVLRRITQQDVPENPDFVRVMSLHKSKGLTSKSVFIMALVDGILPRIFDNGSFDEANGAREEQRRLLYVGITRSANQLVLSNSRFLGMADAHKYGVAPMKTMVVNNRTVVRLLPTPFLAELGSRVTEAIPGSKWIEEYRDRPIK